MNLNLTKLKMRRLIDADVLKLDFHCESRKWCTYFALDFHRSKNLMKMKRGKIREQTEKIGLFTSTGF